MTEYPDFFTKADKEWVYPDDDSLFWGHLKAAWCFTYGQTIPQSVQDFVVTHAREQQKKDLANQMDSFNKGLEAVDNSPLALERNAIIESLNRQTFMLSLVVSYGLTYRDEVSKRGRTLARALLEYGMPQSNPAVYKFRRK